MTRTTPELDPPFQTSSSYQREDVPPTKYDFTCNRPNYQREDVSPTTYDFTCNRPNTRRILSGIGVRTWKPLGFEADILPLGHSFVKCLRK
ncbi:hypothetical protein AVEN_140778-1 [Araneus ventricosus]|uniref:Uncharacterized protein n=1 Tax=Araneus ventricosus TaxID=182803 RepID=A0A4Y2T494_ARAVE|nr:hypothetical protein AVEN_240035-1 [Araneus ventricosus]GBN94326.1 hypothetical protein AVEN_140778-1 [Araneus ventricosus]